jgi:peptide/nickel transport system substrate-binding protein
VRARGVILGVRAVVVLALATAALLAFIDSRSSAASQSHAEGTIPLLRIGSSSPPGSTLDPGQMFNQIAAAPISEGLIKFGPKGELQPNLAEKFDRPSPAVYVFHLRHGVKFWDGNEMTSADVVASLKHEAEPTQAASSAYQNVKSLVATDKYTVTLTLKHADAGFLQALAWQGTIFEKAFYDQHKGTFGKPGTLVMQTGPWQIASFDPTTGIEYTANPHYWGGPVNIDRISLKFFADETSEALAFRTGAIDVSFPTAATAFASASGAKLQSVPAGSLGLFGMNTKMAPWNDVHVRRAVAYALNRAELVKALGTPALSVATIIPPSQLDSLGSKQQVDALLKSLPNYPFSIAKAKAELAKSKYPHGFSTSTDTAKGGVASVPVSEAIAGMLGKIGIKMKVRILGGDAWINELAGPKKFGATFTTFNIPSPDPSAFPSWILGSKNTPNGGWNWANYGPPMMDTLLAQGTSAADPTKRLATYGKILKKVGQDVPYISLFIQEYNMALSPKFSWPGFNQNYGRTPWPLELKTAA